jgi:hypothetical protein
MVDRLVRSEWRVPAIDAHTKCAFKPQQLAHRRATVCTVFHAIGDTR